MKKWYIFYTKTDAAEKLRQLDAEIPLAITKDEKLQQPVAEFPQPFGLVPWGHHLE